MLGGRGAHDEGLYAGAEHSRPEARPLPTQLVDQLRPFAWKNLATRRRLGVILSCSAHMRIADEENPTKSGHNLCSPLVVEMAVDVKPGGAASVPSTSPRNGTSTPPAHQRLANRGQDHRACARPSPIVLACHLTSIGYFQTASGLSEQANKEIKADAQLVQTTIDDWHRQRLAVLALGAVTPEVVRVAEEDDAGERERSTPRHSPF